MTERDDAVSRRYRELPAEEPPRALDEAILAASRRAVDARPAPLVAPAGRQRWYVPLAAAAVIVLAVGLTLRVQLEQPEDVTARMEMSRAAGAPSRAPEPALARAPEPTRAPATSEPANAPAAAKMEVGKLEDQARNRMQERPVERSLREARPHVEAPTPAPFPAEPSARVAPAAPAPQADARAAESTMMQRAPAASAPAAGAPAAPERRALARSDDAGARDHAERQVASAAAGATAKRLQEAEDTPEKALARIAELRKAGKHDEADKALAEFRKRFPDYKIPEATRERVERPIAR
jgi:hypothetical protein